LLQEGLVEAVLVAQERDLLHRCGVALALQLGDFVGQEVAGRQPDDREREKADHEQGRDHDQRAVHDVFQHGLMPFT
jgi:hypothetical protein